MNLLIKRPKEITAMYVIIMLCVFLNIFMMPDYLMAQIFALVFITITYFCFSESFIKFIYYITILFSFIDYGLVMPISSKYDIYFYYLTLLVFYIAYFLKNKINFSKASFKQIFSNKYSKFIIIFFIYMLLGIFIVVNKKDFIKSVYVYVIMFSYLMMFVLENKKLRDIKNTMKFIEAIYIGILSLGFLKVMGLPIQLGRNKYTDMGYSENSIAFLHRMPMVFSYNPNNFAVLTVIAMIVIGVKIYSSKDRKYKIYYWILFILSQINLIFSMGRIAWITVFIVFIFSFFLSIISKDIMLRKTSIKILLVMAVVFLFFSIMPGMNVYYGKFNSLPILNKLNIFNYKKVPNLTIQKTITVGAEGSLSERFTVIYDVLKGVFANKQLLGYGAGNTADYIKTLSNTNFISDIHSLWFEILGDFGIGIFIYYIYTYASLMITLFKDYIHNRDSELGKYMLSGFLLLFGFIFLAFGPSSVRSYIPYWLILGITSCLVINFKSRKDYVE